jgi:hypothetical protein
MLSVNESWFSIEVEMKFTGRRNRFISDMGIDRLARGCPNLTTLDISGCTIISDLGIDSLVKFCPLLSSLDLSLCRYITQRGISAIAVGYPKLISLSISCCGENITESSIIKLAR